MNLSCVGFDLGYTLVHTHRERIFQNVVGKFGIDRSLAVIFEGFSNATLVESSMSYLGLGIQPPTPSLGRMLFEAQAYLFNAPWVALAPGIMIMVIVLGFNYLGDEIRAGYHLN